ncbi:hypothetical protein KKG46_01730 [Patescibacteria group bacterium]|nr:hypothetical protein [Patescibacteria group bacterium]
MISGFGDNFKQLLQVSASTLLVDLERMAREACVLILSFDEVQADCVSQVLIKDWVDILINSAEVPSVRKGLIKISNLDEYMLPKAVDISERLHATGTLRWISESEFRQILWHLKTIANGMPSQLLRYLDIQGYEVR